MTISIDFTIDTSELKSLKKKVDKLENSPHIKSALEQISARFENRIKMLFRKSEDPYGEKWASITHRKGQPLLDTGMLRNSVKSEVRGNDIVIGSPLIYAANHDLGITVTKRSFLPNEKQGLPQDWKDEYVKILSKELENALK